MPGRSKYGEYFGITVAGYPEAHPDAIVSDPAEMDKIYWNDLHYLKEKVLALPQLSIDVQTPQVQISGLASCELPFMCASHWS